MPSNDLLKVIQNLSSKELEALLQKRQAEDKALRVLWRAALSREREEHYLAKETAPVRRKAVAHG